MPKPTWYQQTIREEMARMGFVGAADPRHIEAYMRLEHGTLDGLSRWQFRDEVVVGLECIRQGGVEAAERCALSFGL